ncbi:hypothetical protein D9611_007602 [Ephemerocybe angulata]|uniref:CCHC-type domain-containing protein n=1 Tax=Ephemerocybe angulata TaxID=980116 RepID=A0A8H5BY29_9AGAR|nr:hypothetical protein D9611_007602 [Tulosesus angulatus]
MLVWDANHPPSKKPTPVGSKAPSRVPTPIPSPHLPPPDKEEDKEDPDSEPDPDDSGAEDEIDSDDDMSTSKAKKAFDGINKLAANGSNWAIWWSRVERATKSIPDYGGLLTAKPASTDLAADADLLNAVISLIPDSIYLRYSTYPTTFELITALKGDYNISNAIVEAKSVASLFTTKCDKESEVSKHLDYLGTLRESLIRAGKDISDDHYIDAIISTIPSRLATLATSLRRSYELHNQLNQLTGQAAKSLSVIELLQSIRAECAHVPGKKSSDSANYSGQSSGGSSSSGSRGGRGRSRGHFNQRGRGGGRGGNHGSSSNSSSNSEKSKCHNCGGTGHWSPNCPSPKQPRANSANTAAQAGKPTQPSTSSSNSTPPSRSTTTNRNSRSNGNASFAQIEEIEDAGSAWSAFPTDESAIDLAIWEATCPASIDVSDFFEDVPMSTPVDAESSGACVDSALVAHDSASADNATEVFDSGCSRHMTPYGDSLARYRHIPEQKIRAANAEHFAGIGVGDFRLKLPLGDNGHKTLLLKDSVSST